VKHLIDIKANMIAKSAKKSNPTSPHPSTVFFIYLFFLTWQHVLVFRVPVREP
jgi:hypothetical protein